MNDLLQQKRQVQNEAEWIAQTREGNEQPFEMLFLKYYNRLCNFSCTYIKSPLLAEEIVQDVFTHIWETRDLLDPNENIKAYLYRSVKNRTLDVIEKRKTERRYLKEYTRFRAEGQQTDAPENEYNGQFIREVQKAVDELPERARMIYRLHKKDGLTYTEIAKIMDISIKTVESQMSRALKLLRWHLAKVLGLFIMVKDLFN